MGWIQNSSGTILIQDPLINYGNDRIDFFCRQLLIFFDVMPFIKTASTARGGCVLGNKDRMSFHRGLSTIVFNHGGCQPGADQLVGMLVNGFHALLFDHGSFFFEQMKTASKF